MYSRIKVPGKKHMAGLLLAGSLMVTAVTAVALPPEHEIQRLMLAVEESVKGENWGQAAEYLNRLQRIDGEKPAEYLYYRGEVMARSEHYNEALSALENYVAGTGADGKHYTDALKLITRIEQERSSQSGRSDQGGDEPVAEIAPAGAEASEGQGSMTGDASPGALVARLNRLFDQAGWRRDARLIREGSSPDVHYQVSVNNGELSFRESRQEDGRRQLSTITLPVYGISPMIEWSCENATESCWIYDPRDNSRFLRLGNDRDKADQLASTLGQLIRRLQRPSEGR
ncbi:hypothetical protein SAMN04487962_104154 [Marinobacter segnicrescens]|uniref:Tetratricopeptide repeat-containing protein n=1 Tax=Marinobacter segnicrescens TaxID=430453 RepID=A0A1I0BSG9_9GAMM|nr:hypothetical protein [Marinobacter segnicrescens]SET10009.1 hypothetical protein SAMN04487962_104154 [Marinobacter segnicrescens]